MNLLEIFKKDYILRQFGEQTFEKGYAKSSYQDKLVKLNVQPITGSDLLALPEGLKGQKNLTAIGKVRMKTADEETGTLPDWLYYKGKWYECKGVDEWDHTFIGQTVATFTLITNSENPTVFIPPKQKEDGVLNDDGRIERLSL